MSEGEVIDIASMPRVRVAGRIRYRQPIAPAGEARALVPQAALRARQSRLLSAWAVETSELIGPASTVEELERALQSMRGRELVASPRREDPIQPGALALAATVAMSCAGAAALGAMLSLLMI